jgi:hypothetical protein
MLKFTSEKTLIQQNKEKAKKEQEESVKEELAHIQHVVEEELHKSQPNQPEEAKPQSAEDKKKATESQ